MFYIIGSRGRLGQAIATEYANKNLFSLDRKDYEEWSTSGAVDKISRYFDKPQNECATLFVTSGLLNPNSSKEDLQAINYQLPKNIIEGATKAGMKIVTFGTVMEDLVKPLNPYILSKVALRDYIANTIAKRHEVEVAHLQIHTLYGVGQPSSFMFLGQILNAIKTNQPFKMTSGRQLREYHHLNDESKAIKKIVSSKFRGVSALSHGRPFSLASIAENVFDAFKKRDLLQIGALPDPTEENYEKILKPLTALDEIDFRDPMLCIPEYLLKCSNSSQP